MEPPPRQALASSAPFVTGPEEGEALWHLDSLMTMKAVGAATGGRLAVFHQVLPRHSSPPLNVHHRDDEAWYVLEGELTFQVEGEDLAVPTGAFVWAPRGMRHTFRVESQTAKVLGILAPAGFEEFFLATGTPAPERSLPPPPEGPPDLGALIDQAHRRGCDIVGSPMPPAATGDVGRPARGPPTVTTVPWTACRASRRL